MLKQLHTDPQRGMRLLMDRYLGLVYAVVRGKLSGADVCQADIEACVADTFSEFYCDLSRYDAARGSIGAWLCVMARNNALDLLRKRRKEALFLPLEEAAGAVEGAPPEKALEDKARRAALRKALDSLGKRDREILVRKFFLSQSSKEIAAAMGMTVSTVDTRTHRALQKMRKQWGDDLA